MDEVGGGTAVVAAVVPAPVTTPDGLPAMTAFALDPTTRHLNHGSYGAVPVAAVAAQTALLAEMNARPGEWFGGLPSRVAQVRERAAALLGADVARTALVPNASAGVSTVLSSIELPRGARIVITDHTYGAVRMACERAARRVDGAVVTVPVALGSQDGQVVDDVVAASSDASLVVVDQITSATARLLPVAELTRRLRELGVPVLVDAAHAPAQLADPLAGLDADWWVGNLHKWGCTPRGTAALVAAPRAAAALMPLIDSWGAPDPYPDRFDRQGTIDLTPWLAAPAALDEIEQLFGWEAVRRYQGELVTWAAAHVSERLADVADVPEVVTAVAAPAMRLVPLPTGLVRGPDEAHVLTRGLAALGFQTAITSWSDHAFLRLSAHVYNTADDYGALAETAVPWIGRVARRRGDGDLAATMRAEAPDAVVD